MFSSFNVKKFTQKSELLNGKSTNLGICKKTRSKTGCLCCRKRKKKCDEQHPVCGLCRLKKQECIWEIHQYQPKSPNFNRASQKMMLIKSPIKVNEDSIENLKKIQKVQVREKIQVVDPIEIKEASINLETCKQLDSLNECPQFYSSMIDPEMWTLDSSFLSDLPLINVPTSPFNLYLNEYGVQLLRFFVEKVSKLLCVGPDSSNYFLKTFFTLGTSEEAISNALAAWGAVFLEGPGSMSVNIYLDKASTLMHERYLSKKELGRYDNYVCLCYYLIIIGVHVCSGDIQQWYIHFNSCRELFEKYGGIIKFSRDLDNSNDVKWLLSNFQYHDILSSTSLSNGTICSMNSYNDLFKITKLLDSEDYGIDPYQGCIQPLYLLLGEVVNTKVQLQNERKTLAKLLEDPSTDKNSLNIKRFQFYKKSEEKYFELLTKIEFCNPNKKQLAALGENEVQFHLNLFELYRLVCKIYLMLYIKQTQPKSYDVQNLLLNSLILIETLVDSNLMGALNMAILICGVSCCTEFDRANMSNILSKLYATYSVGNLKKIWEIVEEAWRRNPTGNLCIDWVDICDDFGWVLSIC